MSLNLRPDHFTVLTDDLPVTEAFYARVLGLTVGARPDFKFPGLWLYAGDTAVLHVVQKTEMPNPRAGVIDHIAFSGEGLNTLLQILTEANLDYRIVQTPSPWSQWQIFFMDPNGVKVEVDFNGAEDMDLKYA